MRLAPGATIGILGGGQLGRMLAIAAARLGFACHIYSPPGDTPAFQVAARATAGAWDDTAALASFARDCDAITFEFENVPVETVRLLEGMKPVRPGARALEVAQARLAEKRLARSLGAETAPFAAVTSRAELDAALAAIGRPAILKTNRFGYDGKGQAKIRSEADAGKAFSVLAGQEGILEGFVAFDREVSVVATRDSGGMFAAFDVTENEHVHHILHRSVVPARISPEAAAHAVAITRAIAEALDYVGTLAVEFFLIDARKGAPARVIVNEIAPRVHNSGHWTIDGAVTCQFEQHIRAVAGWPLGDPARRADCEMLNLVGHEIEQWAALVAEPATKLHLYGKDAVRPGRKMGHATRLSPRAPA